MTDPARYWCIVPAAGRGSRMGSALPKQYLPLNGQPVLSHTLERLLAVASIEQIVVALHPEDSHWQTLGLADHPRISTVTGGAERADSVLNGLQKMRAANVADDDWVLVHDAARPCVSPADIQSLISAVRHHAVGGLLGIRLKNTIKQVDNKNAVTATADRNRLWSALTPQMFRFGKLYHALTAARKNHWNPTDESMAMELAGFHPLMVEGSEQNIKITLPEDLSLAGFILDNQANNQSAKPCE